MIVDALNRGRGCVDDAGVGVCFRRSSESLEGRRVVRAVREAGGNVDVACANERGRDVTGGCSRLWVSASGCASRRTAGRIVAQMSICIDTRVQFDEASRGAPPGSCRPAARWNRYDAVR